jgi:hypothetical protein
MATVLDNAPDSIMYANGFEVSESEQAEEPRHLTSIVDKVSMPTNYSAGWPRFSQSQRDRSQTSIAQRPFPAGCGSREQTNKVVLRPKTLPPTEYTRS